MSLQSISKFKFVSPGVFIDEIDNSQFPKTPERMGPVVIGRAARGPGMRPVVVQSFSEFIEIFGNPVAGGGGGDIWRNGNTLGPTYGAYAAQAWLKNSNPTTFIRLVGEEHENAEVSGYAGWKASDYDPGTAKATNGGAFGLFVANTASVADGNIGDMALAAVFYINGGSVRLVGPSFDDPTGGDVDYAAHLVLSSGDNFEFKAIVEAASDSTMSPITASFNLDRNSARYIRKVFNTNPTLCNSAITSTNNLKSYWLGETFERFVYDTATGSTLQKVGCILALDSTDWTGHDYRIAAQKPKSGWVISQDMTDNTGSFDPADMTKLFRFHGLEQGDEWTQKNLKISVKDIQAATNDYDPYGSFTVEIRSARDTDNAPKIYERYSACNLNPASNNYIAKKIGDMYITWDEIEKKYKDYGNYANASKWIRIEMSQDVEAGAINSRLLPFGFFGPPIFTVTDDKFYSGSGLAIFADEDPIRGVGSVPHAMAGATDAISGCPDPFTCSFVWPELPLRDSTSTGNVSLPRLAYWGVDMSRNGDPSRYEDSCGDILRAKPLGVDSYDADDDAQTSASFVFSLDDVAWANTSTTQATYAAGNRVAGDSITAGKYYSDAGAPLAQSPSYELVLDAQFNRFTMPLYGATEGLDITEKEPFRNSQWTGTETETTNAPFYTVKKAIDFCADPERVECNIMTIPGLTNDGLTTHLIRTCENRGDALAIIDLEGGYIPSTENTSVNEDNLGDVDTTLNELKERGLNTSYACAYYPWVQMKDPLNGALLWIPPSVAALGTFASTERTKELWWAPAGFSQGGLTNGAAGLPIIGVREKLTSKERDKLYEYNVNPIASFPAEGIVIYGNKTLQVTPSALDRVNVRRLVIYIKKEISRMAATTLFDQNVKATWERFLSRAIPFLSSVKSRYGLDNFKLILDETTTTPEVIDRNAVYAKCILKPTKSIEFFAIDFNITNSGAAFQD